MKDVSDEDGSVWDTAYHQYLYMPPWAEYMNGPEKTRLIDYGPSTGELERARGDYYDSVHGGGLWDEEESTHKTVRRWNPKSRDSFEVDLVRRYVERYSAWLHLSALEVYLSVWQDGRSMADTARIRGMDEATVRSIASDLLRRAKKGKPPKRW